MDLFGLKGRVAVVTGASSGLGADAARVVSHSNSTSNHNLAHGSNSYSARYTYDTDA